MNLSNLVTVIELSSSGIRLVSGYESENRLVILYSVISEPLQLDELGHINKQTAISYLKDLAQKAKSRLHTLGGIILLLPPKGFEIIEDHNSVATISREGYVSLQDYRNSVAMIEKQVKVPSGKKICDMSPTSFDIDEKRGLTQFPLNQQGKMFDVHCDVQFLDADAYDFALSVMNAAGLRPYLTLVTTTCAFTLMSFSNPPVDEYLTLNMDQGYSEIGYVRSGRMMASQYLNFGILDLISIASKALGVTKKRAEELLYLFGFHDSCGFPYYTDEKKTLKDTSQAFEEGMDGFMLRLKPTLSGFAPNLPVLLYGSSSQIPNLYLALQQKMNRTILTFDSHYLGARDQEYINCLGGIFLGGKTYQKPEAEDTPAPQDNPTMGFHR